MPSLPLSLARRSLFLTILLAATSQLPVLQAAHAGDVARSKPGLTQSQRAARNYEFLNDLSKISRQTVDRLVGVCATFTNTPAPDTAAHRIKGTTQFNQGKALQAATAEYLGRLITNCLAGQQLLTDAQANIATLNPIGVDDGPLALATGTQELFGDVIQGIILIRQMLLSEQENNAQNRPPKLGPGVIGGVITLVSGGSAWPLFTGALADAANEDQAQQGTSDDNLQRLRQVIQAQELHAANFTTKCSQVLLILRSRYPEYDWAPLLPPVAGATSHP